MLKVRGFDQEGRSSLFMIKIMDIYRKLRWLLGVGHLFVCLSPFFFPIPEAAAAARLGCFLPPAVLLET